MRRGAALLGAALLAAGATGCGGGSAATRPPREASPRDAVLAFWESFRSATARRAAGDFEGAAALYARALEHDPRHEDSLYYLGQCQRHLRRPRDARRTFERLVETNPRSSRAHLALGALLASPDDHEPLDLPVAEACFRRAHEINGDETGPMVRLAEVLIVRDRGEEAATWAEAAIRTNPKAIEAALLAASLARERGDHAAARSFVGHARAALRVEAPVQGVLSEGDRRSGPPGSAAPPVENPMGRLLFAEALAAARAQSATGEPDLEALRRAVAGERRRHLRRTTTAASSGRIGAMPRADWKQSRRKSRRPRARRGPFLQSDARSVTYSPWVGGTSVMCCTPRESCQR